MKNDLYLVRTKEGVAFRLILTRRSLALTQVQFARAAKLNATTYNMYEKAVNFPSIEAAHALCDCYKLTFDWIFRGDDSGLRYETGAAIQALYKLHIADAKSRP